MNEIKALLPVLLKEKLRSLKNNVLFGIGRPGNTSSGKKALSVILVLVFLPVIFAIVAVSYMIGEQAFMAGIFRETVSFAVLITQGIIIITATTSIVSTMYNTNDAEILLYLPVRSRNIFVAKLIIVYVSQLASALVFALCVYIPLGVGAGIGAWYFLGLLIAVFFIPFLPLFIAAFIGMPVMYLISLFRNKGAVGTFLLCLLFAVVFAGYYMAIFLLDGSGENVSGEEFFYQIAEHIKNIGTVVFTDYWLAVFLVGPGISEALLNLIYVAAFDGVLGILIYLISGRMYRRSISKELEGGKKQKKRAEKIVFASRRKSLVFKDMKEILRNPSLGFMCYMQLIMAVLLPVIFLILNRNFSDRILNDAETRDLFETYSSFIAAGISVISMFYASVNMAACGAFSRENYNISLLKTFPLSSAELYKAKVTVGIIFNEITFLLFFIIMSVQLPVDPVYFLLAFLSSSLYGSAMVYVQVYCDMKKPRFYWKNINDGLKNNYATIVSIIMFFIVVLVLAIIILGCVLLALSGSLTAGSILVWILPIIVGSVFLVLSRKRLLAKTDGLFILLDDSTNKIDN